MSEPLFRREIDRAGLPKRALSILEKCDPLITFYNGTQRPVRSLALYPKDFQFLSEKLRDHGQDIDRVVYRGYQLTRYAE